MGVIFAIKISSLKTLTNYLIKIRKNMKIDGGYAAILVGATLFAYYVGNASSNDTINSLKQSIKSYQESDKLNTEGFISSAIKATDALRLTSDERVELKHQKVTIKEQNKHIEKIKSEKLALEVTVVQKSKEMKAVLLQHKNELSEQKQIFNQKISVKKQELVKLSNELNEFTRDTYDFYLEEGTSKIVTKNSLSVGYTESKYGNECVVTVDGQKELMSPGGYKKIGDCKVTLIACKHGYQEKAGFNVKCQ